ncbi:hypothetical protein LZG04_21085 [Saccharothrix sp. S26]|uniref:hypothetical protein n=1 Tax=Saccharothrix sp. S26 TaxID=2907215 RepID=UPI001F28D098|nr:hypothetical protein [Saccharothrix sp. S26]MCE6997278.1 hypothetical protein [Saccharothrix sp. S26]
MVWTFGRTAAALTAPITEETSKALGPVLLIGPAPRRGDDDVPGVVHARAEPLRLRGSR